MGKIACATAMGLGTAGGWKIIKTVGGNIMKIRPANVQQRSFVCIDNFRSIITTFIINNTRCVFINSGVGASNRAKGVKWSTAQRMVVTWVITLPISAILAGIIYFIIHLFLK